ncbi:hypothetical protein E2562_025876 [Oryza meyeriana var. granulata]|uniref:Uncharacterized protein n=1 Tax=Oryza meyeriana var. granulata TaxID=110450 RepID=A0A6G1D7V6_9ORYZ|nr:hypothetical protein E2562_025876 [Oryza meyeriana var. granulata]
MRVESGTSDGLGALPTESGRRRASCSRGASGSREDQTARSSHLVIGKDCSGKAGRDPGM